MTGSARVKSHSSHGNLILKSTMSEAGNSSNPVGYRSDWESDCRLPDGSVAHLRPVRPEDADALVAFHESLSPKSVWLRFFNVHPHLFPNEIAHFTQVDYHDRVAIVAIIGGVLVAVGRYDRLHGTTTAEVAFVVADGHQGHGIATRLLEQLATAGRNCGLDRFVAETLAQNRGMLEVFHDVGFPVQRQVADGIVRVSFAIDPCAKYLQAHERRAAGDGRQAI
jgi:GNAT superfamily N-acetyltransferase